MSSNAIAERKALTLVPAAELEQMDRLDEVVKTASNQLIEAEKARNLMRKGLVMARATKMLRAFLTDKMMEDVMELMNTPFGFRTDRPNNKNQNPYSKGEVRDVLIQSLMRGLQPVNNQWNIIAGNFYVTKEGYETMLREFPGLAKLAIDIGVPAMVQGGSGDTALVPCRASWELDGRQDMIICEKSAEADYRIPIRVNSGMGTDAIQGKAKSKLYRRVYERLTGTIIASEADTDGGDVIDTTASEVKPAITDGKQQPEQK